MKLAARLFGLLAVALAAIAVGAVPAMAVTVTPSGKWEASGTATLTADEGTVTCDWTSTGNQKEDGSGSVSVTFSNCTGPFSVTCTAKMGSLSYTISNTAGDFSNTKGVTGTVKCEGIGFDCNLTAGAGNVTGTVTTGDEPTIALSATPASVGCTNASITASGTVTSTNTSATGKTGNTTGNELTITA